MPDESGEVLWAPGTACVRLDPNNSGEVVWGQRIDPARMVILNVPLPESGRRFHDIVLNDGAVNGSRINEDGAEVPVFDELSIWKVSEYSTFRVIVHIPEESAEKHLVDLCLAHQLGIEDWTTIRKLCAKCSQGNPGPHECDAKPLEDGSSRFGFGAKNEDDLLNVLRQWSAAVGNADYGKVELVLSAKPV